MMEVFTVLAIVVVLGLFANKYMKHETINLEMAKQREAEVSKN